MNKGGLFYTFNLNLLQQDGVVMSECQSINLPDQLLNSCAGYTTGLKLESEEIQINKESVG